MYPSGLESESEFESESGNVNKPLVSLYSKHDVVQLLLNDARQVQITPVCGVLYKLKCEKALIATLSLLIQVTMIFFISQ